MATETNIIKVGYADGFFGEARKYEIVGELKVGGYVIRSMPTVYYDSFGKSYLLTYPAGLGIISTLTDIHEEMFDGKEFVWVNVKEVSPEICPVCQAHKSNYKEAMGRDCSEEHGG